MWLGGQIVEKRRYDSAKFGDHFQDGRKVHTKLMDTARTSFFIYVVFEDSHVRIWAFGYYGSKTASYMKEQVLAVSMSFAWTS